MKFPLFQFVRRIPVALAVALTIEAGNGQGGGQLPLVRQPPLSESRVPPTITSILAALGDRLTKLGRERMVWTGSIAEAKGSVPIAIITEFPGKIRVEDTQGRRIGFDGTEAWNARGALDDAERDLLESLTTDTADGFLDSIVRGVPSRLLGRRFRVDDGRTVGYKGPYYDIFELVVTPSARGDRQSRVKRFYFESETGRLQKVIYSVQRAGQPTAVVISFSGWRTVDNQAVPAQIARSENDRQVLSIQISGVQFQAAGDNVTFRRP